MTKKKIDKEKLLNAAFEEYKKRYPNAKVEYFDFKEAGMPEHFKDTIMLSWKFGSYVIVGITEMGNKKVVFKHDRGLDLLPTLRLLNHFNEQDENYTTYIKKNINSDVGDLKNEELIITLKKDK